MAWFYDGILILIGFLIIVNGWIIPYIGFAFLALLFAGEVYASIKSVKEKEITKSEMNKNNEV